MSKYNLLIRYERKRRAVELLGGECSRCGYNQNLAAIDFHHLNPLTKDGEIGTLIANGKWNETIKEIKKCVLLCKNCHMDTHYQYMRVKKSESGDVNYIDKNLLVNRKCEQCGQYAGGRRFCSEKCDKFSRRKAVRPLKIKLKCMLKGMSLEAIGREYGVSGKAVKKWAKNYGLQCGYDLLKK